MTSEPPLVFFFTFFCNHLSKKTVSVMSLSGSPVYVIALPSSNVRDIAETEGCALAARIVSSHQHDVSARAYNGSLFSMSYLKLSFGCCCARVSFAPSSSSDDSSPKSFLDSSLVRCDVSSPSKTPVCSVSSASSLKCSSPSSSVSRGWRIAFQCDGCLAKNSLIAIRDPQANVAGACAATCKRRLTNAAARLGTTSSRKLLKTSERICAVFVERKSPGCNNNAYNAR
mmetsp:Transcript_1033/g.2205  ORF Transcript_1033/g.2205 Transcript_1033/m.2205 type:complete len:228 (-) Transcript_1033:312-995(-)